MAIARTSRGSAAILVANGTGLPFETAESEVKGKKRCRVRPSDQDEGGGEESSMSSSLLHPLYGGNGSSRRIDRPAIGGGGQRQAQT